MQKGASRNETGPSVAFNQPAPSQVHVPSLTLAGLRTASSPCLRRRRRGGIAVSPRMPLGTCPGPRPRPGSTPLTWLAVISTAATIGSRRPRRRAWHRACLRLECRRRRCTGERPGIALRVVAAGSGRYRRRGGRRTAGGTRRRHRVRGRAVAGSGWAEAGAAGTADGAGRGSGARRGVGRVGIGVRESQGGGYTACGHRGSVVAPHGTGRA